ncbi:hypothetical protein [Streptomyces fuscigenes]|uniref:hypothetical protein n=1 Tax=Streptomyces fuscigenes TaxID=1528880 RepID=UPI001F2336E3|nr:hypothetical protein [Streptomyces fuscigenes]MCF3961384.1 hypothetical protein [Streptomyces fuscigenes]
MNNNSTPLSSPRPGCDGRPAGQAPAASASASVAGAPGPRLLTTAQLRERGVSAATASAQSRPFGPWQQLLPGVYLLHRGPVTGEDRMRAALLYAGRAVAPRRVPGPAGAPGASAMLTGLAALAARGFESAPSPLSLEALDVLVPRTRRLRSTGFVRLTRAAALPEPELVGGLALAPVARALADAVADLPDAGSVRRLLTEAVRDGYCEPGAIVAELAAARLLSRPHVVGAVDALLAEGRARAEDRLYALVRDNALPEPLWNVDLRLPGGPHLGGVDAFWPDQAVAVELDTRAPRFCGSFDSGADDARWDAGAAKREHLERLGITVVHLTPRKLREAPEQQTVVVRTALTAADDREPAAYVVVLPR